jgi:hypothetical protein
MCLHFLLNQALKEHIIFKMFPGAEIDTLILSELFFKFDVCKQNTAKQ